MAGQVTVFQVKTPAFQILKALLYRPALGVALAYLLQTRGTEEEEKLAAGQGLDPHLPPHPIHLALGKAPVLPLGKPQVGNGVAVAVRVREQVVLGQTHDEVQTVVLEPLEPYMAHQLTVAHDQADARAAEQGQADLEQGDALGGVGVAAAVVEQLPVQRYVKRALAHGDEQNIDLTPAEIPFRAIDAQPQLTRGRQQADKELCQHEIVQGHEAEKMLNPGLIRGRFGRVVEVLGYFAKRHVAALYQPDNKLRDELLPREVAHQGHVL